MTSPALLSRRFLTATNGAAMVEFTILLPVLALLMLASIEATVYLSSRDSATDAMRTAGDLTTQSEAVTDDTLKTIFAAATSIISEDAQAQGAVKNLQFRLTSVIACDCQDPLVTGRTRRRPAQNGQPDEFCYVTLWSHRYRATGRQMGLSEGYPLDRRRRDIPDDLVVAENETLIIAEVVYKYRPALRFAMPSAEIAVSERYFIKPRSSQRIVHLGSQARQIEPQCD